MLPLVADQRILRGAPAVLAWTNLDSDGAATPASGAVTVGVVSADGTTVLAAGTATSGSNPYTVALTAAQTDDLDVLTVTWTVAGGGTHTTYVEIVGGYYFTIDEARDADVSLQDADKYPDADIITARREVEDECEEITGRAWVPRYRYVTLNGTGGDTLQLPDSTVRVVRSVSIGGAAVSVGDITVDLSGRINWSTTTSSINGDPLGLTFTYGRRNVVVGYEHGATRPPPEIKRAAIQRLRHKLNAMKSGIPDRATNVTSIDGITYRVSQPGKRRTGVADVDAVYERYAVQPLTAGTVPIG